MRAIVNTLRYQTRVYLRSNKPIMPFAVLILLVGLLYAVMPVLPADSYAASATVLSFVSAWLGLSYAEVEDPVSEQLIVLKLGSIVKYQAAYTLFLVLVGLAAGALAVVLPLIQYAIHGEALYEVQVNVSTVLYALVLHTCVAFMGTSTGAFFHPRLFPNRQITLLLICFALLLGFVKIGLHRMFPFTAALTWIFPPISEISETFSGMGLFSLGPVAAVAGRCLLYGGVLTAIRITVIARRRFA